MAATSQSLPLLLLNIQDATLVRGNHTVFSALSLNLVEPRIGLIGDNGAGKSSLFRMACGLDTPRTGSVQVQGLPAHQVSSLRPGEGVTTLVPSGNGDISPLVTQLQFLAAAAGGV